MWPLSESGYRRCKVVSRSHLNVDEIQSKLVPWFQKKMPQARDISVSDMKPPEGGFSSETLLFELIWHEAGQRRSQDMVFRRPPKLAVFPDYDLRRQFLVMQRLQGTGIPVPRVRWNVEQDEGIMGTPFYVMEKSEGVNPPDFPLYHSYGSYFDATPQKRARMWWGCLEQMVKIHKLDWTRLRLDFLGPPRGGTATIDGLLDYYEGYMKWVAKDERQPILEAALKWLRENHYVPERITLCWGDCRMPNSLYNQDGDVAAVLDWELAYLGDPISDLAWFLFLDWHNSEAYGIPKLEGTPGEEETVRRYQELTGWRVNNLFYNRVLAPLRAGVSVIRVYKNLRQMGVNILADDAELNNPFTQRIASLLDLPAPGRKKEAMKVEEMKATLQVHLTGPGARDFHMVSDHGKLTTYEGTAENPEVTLTLSATDWEAIRRGELGRADAVVSGKVKIDGDSNLAQILLDSLISKIGGHE
jgi:aminoglycoside phosphotransferase (APT) family kinase protein/putative sterol carrier protein